MSAPTRAQQSKQPKKRKGWLTLPNRAKPSRATAPAKDLRPALMHGYVRDVGDGRKVLYATDAYTMAQLDVPEDIPAGPISREALKRIEAGAEHTVKAGKVEIIEKATGSKVVYPAPKVERMPPTLDELMPSRDGQTVVRIGLNPELLLQLADALGADCRHRGVILDVIVRDGTTLRGIKVTPQTDVEYGKNGRVGILMPIRVGSR